MKNRPVIFAILSLGLAAIALSFPLQLVALYHRRLHELVWVIAHLTPANWAVIVTCLVSSRLAWNASPALKYMIPLSVIAVGWNNWLVGTSRMDFPPIAAAIGFAAFVLIHTPLLTRTNRKVIKNSGLRWWLVPSRKKVQLSLTIQTLSGDRIPACTFEMSESGAFIPIDISQLPMSVKKFKTPGSTRMLSDGRFVTLRIALGPFHEVMADAEIVRTAPGIAGSYPGGIGVRFTRISQDVKKKVMEILSEAPMLDSRDLLADANL